MERSDPWAGAVAAPLAGRLEKPRTAGLTMVIDKGLGLRETEDLLELAAGAIDYIKLAFGSSLLYPEPVLERKIALIRERGIHVYPGGTLYELAFVQGKAAAFAQRARDLGFTVLEVSEGTVDLSPAGRRRMIEAAAGSGACRGDGSGEEGPGIPPPGSLGPGAGRGGPGRGGEPGHHRRTGLGGGVGAYDQEGRPREELVEVLLREFPRPEALMWEAPLAKQQLYWIRRAGPNVNLGNVQPGDVLTLEAMRRALRGDTLKRALCRLTEVFGERAQEC